MAIPSDVARDLDAAYDSLRGTEYRILRHLTHEACRTGVAAVRISERSLAKSVDLNRETVGFAIKRLTDSGMIVRHGRPRSKPLFFVPIVADAIKRRAEHESGQLPITHIM